MHPITTPIQVLCATFYERKWQKTKLKLTSKPFGLDVSGSFNDFCIEITNGDLKLVAL